MICEFLKTNLFTFCLSVEGWGAPVCPCTEARGPPFRVSFSHVVLRIKQTLPALASHGLKLKVCDTAHGRRLASSYMEINVV